jgi:subfamily B ATP-binding cassette protein MsbA
MKKFSRILKYVSQPKYRSKLFFYLLFTILSVLFGLISLGMLSPFMELLFKGKQVVTGQPSISSHTVGSLKDFLNPIIQQSPTTGLIVICLFIVGTTIFKNLFLYLSYYISSPIRTATITQLRSELYEKILSLPIGFLQNGVKAT